MIEKFRWWLLNWLGPHPQLCKAIMGLEAAGKIQQIEIRELRAEVTRLSVAQYVPPETPEPKKKVIQTRNMREFNAILERELENQFEEA